MKKHIYLDYAATTPTDPRVFKKAEKYFTERFANPSSVHFLGEAVRADVEKARERVADTLNCNPEEIIFTGGGTEAENLALKGIAFSAKAYGKHIIISKVEHNAVYSSADFMEKQGFMVSRIAVDSECRVNPKDVAKEIRDETTLISIMYANNEVGTIQPIQEIAAIVKKENKKRKKDGKHPIRFHVDAEAACFYMDCNVKKLGVDALTINGSKMYGLKGAAALYVKKGTPIATQIVGGGQERMLRGGTENVPGVIALSEAAKLAKQERKKNSRQIQQLREELIKQMGKHIPTARLNTPNDGVVNIVHYTLPTVPKNRDIIKELSRFGIAASQGSACSSNKAHPPHVLPALGFSSEEIRSSIRFSLGKGNTKSDIVYTVKTLYNILQDE